VTAEITARFNWTPVGPIRADPDSRVLSWPRMPTGSGVYRFTLRLGGRTRYYVGETDGYARRFAHYANPGPTQSTNVRMKARLLTLLVDHGGAAELHVATDVAVTVDGHEADLTSLPGVFVRRLLENAALVEVATAGGEIVNGKGFPAGELWPT
jgi:hypothetical protein